MKANELIEAYVTDVALQLPRRQRNSVAFELRALLQEELQGRAGMAGREADAALATDLLRSFGRPADVAARYRPTLTIIDPADGHAFLRATVIGLLVIWILGAVSSLREAGDLLRALTHWWGTAVLPSLWWPGVLVTGYGLAAWSRRRSPPASDWQPRDADAIGGGRVALSFGLVGIVCGVLALIDPRWLLDFFWDGRAAPAAYTALTYTESFRHGPGPWLLGLLLLNLPLLGAVLVKGRWTPGLRRLELVHGVALYAVMAWTIVAGPVFMAAASDRACKFALVVIIGATLIGYGIKWYRRVSPRPE